MNKPDEFHLHVCNTATLCDASKKELIDFAKKVSRIQEHYLLNRLNTYDQIIFWKRSDRLRSFQLIQHFEQNNDVYVYFGPLFSRLNGYLPMFVSFFHEILQLHREKKIYLAAEIQNPEILLLFKALFGTYCYPQLNAGTYSDDVRNIALAFATILPHMKNIDVDNLSTAATETLYPGRSHYPIIEKWLRDRGVDHSIGQSQVLIMPVPSDEDGRKQLLEQLQKGLDLTRNWKQSKKIILQQFEEGMLYV